VYLSLGAEKNAGKLGFHAFKTESGVLSVGLVNG